LFITLNIIIKIYYIFFIIIVIILFTQKKEGEGNVSRET